MTPTNLLDETGTRLILRLTRHFVAPREAVFRAWTDPEALAVWFGPDGVRTRKVVSDARPGGCFSLEIYESDGVYPVSGVYREVTPPDRLVVSWIWGNGELEGLETVVTVELREADGGTELTLLHEGLPTDVARGKHEGGWVSSFDCLDRFLADTQAE